MRKLLLLTYNAFIIFISSFFLGCNQPIQNQHFYPKTYNEYYNACPKPELAFNVQNGDAYKVHNKVSQKNTGDKGYSTK